MLILNVMGIIYGIMGAIDCVCHNFSVIDVVVCIYIDFWQYTSWYCVLSLVISMDVPQFGSTRSPRVKCFGDRCTIGGPLYTSRCTYLTSFCVISSVESKILLSNNTLHSASSKFWSRGCSRATLYLAKDSLGSLLLISVHNLHPCSFHFRTHHE